MSQCFHVHVCGAPQSYHPCHESLNNLTLFFFVSAMDKCTCEMQTFVFPQSVAVVLLALCLTSGLLVRAVYSSRFLENHDSSFEFNSTACRELRQEIIDVKVLTMWVIPTQQANIDLRPQHKDASGETTNVGSIYNSSILANIVFHVVLVICVFSEYWIAEEKTPAGAL